MPISWKTSDGNTGIAENDYEFAMQHSNTEAKSDKSTPQVNSSTKGDREELAPQDRINQAFGEGPAAPDIKDQNAPYSWGMDEDLKGPGTLPDATDEEYEKTYGPKPTMREGTVLEQFASFQKRLDSTPPEEAGVFRKFLGSLNIMPAPGKPEAEWTAKEHFGVLLNTAMAGMGGGIRVGKPISIGRAANENINIGSQKTLQEPEHIVNAAVKVGEQLFTGPNHVVAMANAEKAVGFKKAQEAVFDRSIGEEVDGFITNTGRFVTRDEAKAIQSKKLTTETEPQLQQAQHQGTPWPEGWATKLPEGKRILSASDYPHIQKAFKEAVEQGNKTSSEVSDYILEKHGIDLSSYMVKRLQETSGVKLEDRIINATNSGWTPELIGKLKEGFDKGKSFQTLADELGQSRGQVAGKVSRLLKEGVLVDRPTMTSGVEANPEKMARFKELRSKGLSYKEIADDLNITTSYARVIASRNKI